MSRVVSGRSLVHKRTEYGKEVRKAYEAGEIKEPWENVSRLEPRSDGISNTITTVLKDCMYLGKVKRMDDEMLKEDGFEGENMSEESWDESDDEDGLDEPEAESGKTVEDYLYTAKDGEQYGIFKLSPRECGRLMGVRDADITKMLSVNSNSQCYKQFGNSIVVPVLMAIFSQLHISGVKAWNDMTEAEREELVVSTTIDWERVNG